MVRIEAPAFDESRRLQLLPAPDATALVFDSTARSQSVNNAPVVTGFVTATGFDSALARLAQG